MMQTLNPRALFVRFYDQPDQQPVPALNFTAALSIVAGACGQRLAELLTVRDEPGRFTVWESKLPVPPDPLAEIFIQP